MATVTIYGASDDLVEIEGDLREEVSFYDEIVLLAFGDGTILKVEYDDLGIWRITRSYTGTAEFSKDEDPGNDENRYSDRVTLTGDLKWVFTGADPTVHKITVPS